MGNLTSNVRNRGQGSAPVKVVLLGLDAAGKTTILYKLKSPAGSQGIVTTIPTIGFNVETLRIRGTIFTAWDVGGRCTVRQLHRYFFRDVDAIIFVVDSNDEERLDQAKDELHRALTADELRCKPLLLLCNKQDLPNALSPSLLAERLGLVDSNLFVGERPWLAAPCVATTGQGLHDGLDWFAKTRRGDKGDASSNSTKTDASSSQDVSKEDNGKEKVVAEDKQKSVALQSLSDFLGFDPTVSGGNLALQRFAAIQRGTECPFAKSAKLWGGTPPLHDNSSLEEQAKANVKPLTEFVRRSQSDQERLDGFCVELDDPLARGTTSTTPEDLGECVRRFLTALSDDDPQQEAIMRVNYIGRRGWRFRFAGADFFVTTFAPCYPPSSSRYAFGCGRAFLLLQPETSFVHHDLPLDTPATNWELSSASSTNQPTVRDKTRVAFRKAGRSYHIPTSTRYPPAEHIVKPLHDDGTNVVKWWAGRVE